jgi:putative CocE/NonD family hydrolase
MSDPAKPVPYRTRSSQPNRELEWGPWLVDDQREASRRTDVAVFVSGVLKEPVKISGQPIVNLKASTSGTDSDWVVKVIDVYPDRMAPPVEMSGYELPLATDIFRGRYRTSFEHPAALTPNEPLEFKFGLPMINHTFKPGHRIMVQVQSTLFPLYDRNPQTFVPNIFDAKAGDYQKATQRIWHKPGRASYVSLPVVPVAE